MANETILPDSVAKAAHIKALDILAADKLDTIDIGVVMINLIDSTPAVALPYLAEQFNVLGYKGWKFADTEDKQRDLLKRAIELHRYKGTAYGIKEALKLAGVVGAIEVRERVVPKYNGEWFYNGLVFYGHHWAYFRVLIDIANLNGLSLDDIRGVIAEYKNARSWLLDVTYYKALGDKVGATDEKIATVKASLSDKVGVSENLDTTVI